MEWTATTVIGEKDIYLAGLVTTLRASQVRIVHEVSIKDQQSPLPATAASNLFIVVEPRDAPERARNVVVALRRRFASACIVVIPQDDGHRWTSADGVDACFPRSISSRAFLLAAELLMFREVSVGWPPLAALPDVTCPKLIKVPGDHADRALSTREREILTWLARGQSNKAIAKALAIEEATVKGHVRTVLRKTGAINRTQAAVVAHEWLAGLDVGMAHAAN
jgi:two-component system, NarL family, nitrate/nitrite response regulator NarL